MTTKKSGNALIHSIVRSKINPGVNLSPGIVENNKSISSWNNEKSVSYNLESVSASFSEHLDQIIVTLVPNDRPRAWSID